MKTCSFEDRERRMLCQKTCVTDSRDTCLFIKEGSTVTVFFVYQNIIFENGPTPATFCLLWVFSNTNFTEIRIRIVRLEGKHDDHLTTTAAQTKNIVNVFYLGLPKQACVYQFLHLPTSLRHSHFWSFCQRDGIHGGRIFRNFIAICCSCFDGLQCDQIWRFIGLWATF